jgi:hypothetical protein
LSVAGVSTIEAFHQQAVLEMQSPGAHLDSQVHSMMLEKNQTSINF